MPLSAFLSLSGPPVGARASEVIPRVQERVVVLRQALEQFHRTASRSLDPLVRRHLELPIVLAIDAVREALGPNGMISGDIQNYPLALQGIKDAWRLLRTDLATADFWTEFGPAGFATTETLDTLERILSDLDTWKNAISATSMLRFFD